MAFRIGDKVRFLNETGEGVIVRFKDKLTAWVELEDGMEIPYPVKQLVPFDTELIFKRNETEEIGDLPEDEEILSKKMQAFYFIVEPDHAHPILQSVYSLYLLNTSKYQVLFTYSVKSEEYFQTIKQGELGPSQKILLKKINKNQMKDYAYHKIDAIFFSNTHYFAQLPTAEVIHLNDKVLSNSLYIQNESFKFPVLAFTLKEDFIGKATKKVELTSYDIERLKNMKEFSSEIPSSKPSQYGQIFEQEIDLHIEELVDSVQGMNNFEMLQLQLRKFQESLNLAHQKGVKKLIVIHGVGNGRLKTEIRSILKNYPEYEVMDASYKRYGYGATQINLF
jgi:hypothetical protein